MLEFMSVAPSTVARSIQVAILLAPWQAVHASDLIRLDFSPTAREQLLLRSEAAPQKTARAPRCKMAPKIDGRLDDEAWGHPSTITDFSFAQPATSFRACFGERALFLGVECADLPGHARKIEPAPRDGAVWKNDCIEIWIETPAKPAERYHLVIDAAGGIYDARNGKVAYNPEWRHAVATADERWTVEFALPMAALGLGSWLGRLKFNIGRHVPGRGRPVWCGTWGGAERGALILEGIPWAGAAPESDEIPIRSTDNVVVIGTALAVECSRPYARPGDRYIEAKLAIVPGPALLGELKLRGRLKPVRSAKAAAEVAITPTRSQGRAVVDLRAAGLDAATLDLTLEAGGTVIGAATLLLHAKPAVLALKPGQRIPVPIGLPDGASAVNDWPVVFGFPFPEGALWDPAQVRLVDRDGKEIAHQKEVSGRWAPDGAVKWLRFEALVSSDKGCYLEVAAATEKAKPTNPVRVSEADGKAILETGDVQYVLARGPSPIEEIRLTGRTVATALGTRGLYVIDQKGRLGIASEDGETMIVESRGPVAACVRFEGFYRDGDGTSLARHITRVECWAGRREAKVTHTLVMCNDTNEVWLKDIGWELSVAPGAQPGALFGAAREPWDETERVPLTGGVRSAYMIQDDHYYYAHRENHFAIKDGEREVRSGEECGDWAALVGASGGLALNCAELARQHPKEFEVFPDRIVLRLFSNRGGDELDFRAATLVKKWNLTDWLDHTLPKRFRDNQENETTAKLHSNALGWSKTHDLLVMPLGPDPDVAALAKLSRLQREPVHAGADPNWLYQTRALGRLHPRDREHFPEIEKMLDDMIAAFLKIRAEWGEYGFMDFPGFAPHAAGNKAKSRPTPKRNFISYALPHGAWLLYARDGDRVVRDYAAGLTRMRNDSLMIHWDGPDKIRGYYANCGSDHSDGSAHMDLPFYWGTGRSYSFCPNVTMVNDLTWCWYLTGDRRMRDCLDQYVDALKKHWTPQETKRAWRITWNFGRLVHLYDYSWDPLIAGMADLTADAIYDPECSFGITSDTRIKSYTTTYKIWIDLRDIIMAWRIFGQERFHALATKICEHVWGKRFLKQPTTYDCADGIIADFLYYEQGDTSVVESLRIKLEQLLESYHKKGPCMAQPYMAFYFEGIPGAQDILRRHDDGREHTASWAACEDFGSDVAFCTRKEEDGLRFRTWSSGGKGVAEPYRLRAMKYSAAVKSLTSVDLIASRAGWMGRQIHVPKDAPATDLAMAPVTNGTHEILSDRPCPLVLHAPSYWKPSMVKEPMPRVYFKLPEGEQDGQIFLEGKTRLYAPDGALHGPEEGVAGWTPLPGDRPGLWSFEPLTSKLVRVRNLPPFFAFERKANYFEPAIEWSREEVPPEPEPFAANALYVPGAIDLPDNQALYFRGRRRLTLDAQLDGGERTLVPRARAPSSSSSSRPGAPSTAPRSPRTTVCWTCPPTASRRWTCSTSAIRRRPTGSIPTRFRFTCPSPVRGAGSASGLIDVYSSSLTNGCTSRSSGATSAWTASRPRPTKAASSTP